MGVATNSSQSLFTVNNVNFYAKREKISRDKVHKKDYPLEFQKRNSSLYKFRFGISNNEHLKNSSDQW